MMDRKITLNDYEESNMLPSDTDDFATLVDMLKKDNINTNLTAVLIKLMRYLRQNNFIVPITSGIMFIDMIKNSDFNCLNKSQFMYISKAVFCTNQLEYDCYEDLFQKFFFNIEITSLELLAENEKRMLEKQLSDSRATIKQEIEKIQEESLKRRKEALEEVLSANFKVYRDHNKLLDEIQKDTVNRECSFDKIKNQYLDRLKQEDDSKLTAAFIELKKDVIRELSSKEEKIDFNDIKNKLQQLMMENLMGDNNEDLNKLLLQSANTVTKVDTELSKLLRKVDKNAKEAKLQREQELNKINSDISKEIENVKVKLSAKSHRESFQGKGAVIELLRNGDKSISRLNKTEYQSLLYYIKVNAAKFRTKVGASMKQDKNKEFDFRKTIQDSVKYNGIPLKFYYKRKIKKKYKLFCILDVSGSVSKYLEALSLFLYELNTVFNGGIEIYGFVSDLLDFTDVFKNQTVNEAVKLTQGRRGYSNYNKALNDFYDNCYQRIDKESIILYFGDARNNKNASGKEILSAINSKAGYSVWLNSEEHEKWDTGDSIMSTYSKYVNSVFEINTVEQMIYFLNNFSMAS